MIGALVAGLVATPLALGFAAPVQANVATKIAAFPYTQDWSNAGLITVDDNWSGVPGIQGYRGDGLSASTGTDPQTVVADGSAVTNVDANGLVTSNTGGLLELDGQSVAFQGSGTADAPHLVLRLDLTGRSGAVFAFNAKDIDTTADNSIQPVAVQYRVGSTGNYTNLPAGFIADASSGPSLATRITPKSVPLPAATDGKDDVYVRVITSDAVGADEFIGIDDINITTGDGATAVSATNPGPQSATVDQAITPFTLQASGGTGPYSWVVTGLPAGLAASNDGTISGTPTAAGTYPVDATATDAESATASTSFTYTVSPAQAVTPIASIQGTGPATPLAAGTAVTTRGVVTASYPTGGLNGFFLQTGGTGGANDATPGASDGIFVTAPMASIPAVNDSVSVSGTVSESFGRTQIASTNVTPIAALPAVTTTSLPWTELDTDAEKEAHEGERIAPQGPFTVTNSFTINTFGEVGLASGTTPLIQPTEVRDAQTENPAEITAQNDARKVVLDDGSSANYLTTARNANLPWVSPSTPVRVGAPTTFTGPVVLDFGFGLWRFQPTAPITDTGAGTATFANTRTAAPENVGGDFRLATFNVLNYFPTTGAEYVASGGTCTYFRDRANNPITNDECSDNGPRGAADAENLARQQAKIVDAINKLGASIVSLEELENSVQFFTDSSRTTRKNRDFAIGRLVAALNAATGADTWAFAPSPAAADLPLPSEEDVIRTGFIYKPIDVALVGPSVVLKDETNFDNAREPLAQAFKAAGAPDSQAFGVIVNHFKSKGSACTSGNDPIQGNCNGDRVGQANALKSFAEDFRTRRGLQAMFLVGDFNSYTKEDPLQVFTEGGGYTALESDTAGEETYSFSGLSGSLDHVLANSAALALVQGVDIWNINSPETTAYQYSRYNYNANSIPLYNADPFSSSDHDPEVVGINAPEEPATRQIQILGTNDFHGRLLNNAAGAPGSTTGTPAGPNTSVDGQAGAAVLSGAVKQLRGQNPDTVFAAAGDLIGASTFESFIQNDNPTIDALNAAGLEVSAAGNHEFDQGYEDLVGRVQDRANWEYLAANIEEPAGRDDLAESFVKDFGSVRVGFVGAVTEDLPSLVSPDGIQGVTVTDIVAATNREADLLVAGGADVVVLLVHEGASTTTCATMDDDPTSAFGSIITGVNDNVDAIVSGHTHLAYDCSFPVPGWSGRPVTDRPVVSSGQYGTNLNKLVFTVDTATGVVQAKTQTVLPLKVPDPDGSGPMTVGPANYPADPAVSAIVADAITTAGPLGAVPVGKIEAPLSRAKFANGVENRGGESTLGNLVAEIQRWATRQPESGSAQIAFMNPGGLRADLAGTATADGRSVTYREAANVQPFANTLVNMDLTGAQIETVLEQQWQTAGNGSVPSRPFLKLGQSEGFEYTYYTFQTPRTDNPAVNRTAGEVTSMKLNGIEIVPTQTYSVTVNSFLASGGDNFRELANGTSRQDTGKSDLQAQVDYFEDFVGASPLEVDYSQRAVGVAFPGQDNSAPAGEEIAFDLTSLIMTGVAGGVTDVKDSQVTVSLDGVLLGTFPVDQTLPAPAAGTAAENASNDEIGKASVRVTIPRNVVPGARNLEITGVTTGTEVLVPITVETGGPVASAVTSPDVSVAVGDGAEIEVSVNALVETGSVPTGTVTVRDGSVLVDTAQLVNGVATLRVPAAALEVGDNALTLTYSGDANYRASTGSVTVTVIDTDEELPTTTSGSSDPVEAGDAAVVRVTVDASGSAAVPTGTVRLLDGAREIGTTVLADGSGSITVPASELEVGRNVFTLSYLGDDPFVASNGSVAITVREPVVDPEPEPELAIPVIDVRHTPGRVIVDRTRAQLIVVVRGAGERADGFVEIRVAGKTYVRKLDDGRVSVKLPRFETRGVKTVFVSYGGNDTTRPRTVTHRIRVTRR